MSELSRRALAYIPRAVFDARMNIVQRETAYAFASWLHANGPLTADRHAAFDALVAQLTDFMAARLSAPVPKKVPRPRASPKS